MVTLSALNSPSPILYLRQNKDQRDPMTRPDLHGWWLSEPGLKLGVVRDGSSPPPHTNPSHN